MIFNVSNGKNTQTQFHTGTFNHQVSVATFTITDIPSKPKCVIVYRSGTYGCTCFAVEKPDGTYEGKCVRNDTSKDSGATWDEDTKTFTIKGYTNYGNYDYYYEV